jgi:hypothetical protein
MLHKCSQQDQIKASYATHLAVGVQGFGPMSSHVRLAPFPRVSAALSDPLTA